ncbi:TPA: tRNA preQ1(34) S-adenosylmethionine ribosyltransferase-isomerase QueA [Candidatus Uhrbacteria bacterium]|nr:tRNA preQ1(34) S-adenosylmethionine ribosyltransferase-isomerase QueA [Candidatus Uhrbacteria bacterium]
MSTPISLFDYYLPPELIAQEPVEPRDSSRLLVLGGGVKGGKEGLGVVKLEHRKFSDVLNYLRAGDVLIFNDTKVFKARLRGTIREKEIEVFLLSSRSNSSSVTAAVGEVWGGGSVWTSLIKPGRAVQVGDKIIIKNLKAEVLEKKEDGTVLLSFEISSERVIEFANEHGEIPVPPYVKKVPEKLETYQTVYARETGSVAAPTAGFHFTKELLEKIKGQGIKIEFVTLHVGLGTFRPVKSETLEEHEMHSELVEIKSEVAQKINAAKKEGRRIIAVGTTTTRALEGVAALNNGSLPINGFFDEVNIFITPGFKFNIIDGLVTNFHLPKSTLLVLISALAGRENILRVYEEAVKEKYRFYSFGDAMLIL